MATAHAKPPPREWRRSLNYDRRFNQRTQDQFNNFPSAQSLQIFEARVPLRPKQLLLSLFVTPELRRAFIVPGPAGEALLRVPFVNRHHLYSTDQLSAATVDEFRRYREALEQATGPLRPTERWVRKKVAHSTYFGYASPAEEFGPYELKLQAKVRVRGEEYWFNRKHDAGRAIANNDLIEVLHGDHTAYTYYPERFAATVRILPGVDYTFSVRDIPPNFRPNPAAGIDVFSLHSLLGNPSLIARLARAAGLRPLEWLLRVYLPKLAAFVATSNLDEGILFEDHAQNIFARVDFNTGLLEIGIKDSADVSFDPAVLYQALDRESFLAVFQSNQFYFLNHRTLFRARPDLGTYGAQRVNFLSDIILLPKASFRVQKLLMEGFLDLFEDELSRRLGGVPLLVADSVSRKRRNLGLHQRLSQWGRPDATNYRERLEDCFEHAMSDMRLSFLTAQILGQRPLYAFNSPAGREWAYAQLQRAVSQREIIHLDGRMDKRGKGIEPLMDSVLKNQEIENIQLLTDRENIYLFFIEEGQLMSIVPLVPGNFPVSDRDLSFASLTTNVDCENAATSR